MSYLDFWQSRIANNKRVGDQIQGACPFCEKEKHFYANVNNGCFDCKKCKECGNVITFLQNHEGLDNKQVADCLESYGLSEQNQQIKKPLNIFNQQLIDYCCRNLTEEKLYEFSKERGLSKEILMRYRLGIDSQGRFTFAKISWDTLGIQK